ncbi:MAG: hypothetical protein F6K58_24530 [Symploca sp. SIO2E9]|nr:hypothetical protein [Symploca sp. SIO2E9]
MTTTPPQTQVFFGVSLELAGKTISLEPKNAITELKEKGIEVELPVGERVYLGTVGSSLESIFSALGVDAINEFLVTQADVDAGTNPELLGTVKTEALPDITALQTAANLVLQAGLFVDEFHVRIPGSGATKNGAADKDKTAYTVGLSAEWQEDAGNLIDSLDLKLKGIYFKVSNEE